MLVELVFEFCSEITKITFETVVPIGHVFGSHMCAKHIAGISGKVTARPLTYERCLSFVSVFVFFESGTGFGLKITVRIITGKGLHYFVVVC